MTVYELLEIGESPIGEPALAYLDGPCGKAVPCNVLSITVNLTDGALSVEVVVLDRAGERWICDGTSVCEP